MDGERKKHLSAAGLKDRRWTDSMIKTLLGQPDETATNPIYKSGPPMRLYLLERVEQTEQTTA
jgi:hypothetical protein